MYNLIHNSFLILFSENIMAVNLSRSLQYLRPTVSQGLHRVCIGGVGGGVESRRNAHFTFVPETPDPSQGNIMQGKFFQ